MQPEAPHTTRPNLPPDPPKDRPGVTVLEGLAAFLYIVRVLLGHGRRLTETVKTRSTLPSFAMLAAALGTHDTDAILTRVQRGILRLMALEKYLLARTKKGREIEAAPPRERAQPRQKDEPLVEAPARPKRYRYNPDSLYIPTQRELDAEVRSRPIGRTIAYICMDLGVVPSFCTGDFWNALFDTLNWYGGSFTTFFTMKAKRAKSYQRERDRYPDTWVWDWRDTEKPRVRQVLGYLIGEDPPDPLPA